MCIEELSKQEMPYIPRLLKNLKGLKQAKVWNSEFEKAERIRTKKSRKPTENNTEPLSSKNFTKFFKTLRLHMDCNPNLEKVCLLGINLTQELWQVLSEGFSNSKCLSSVVINYCELDFEKLKILAPVFSSLESLVTLDLSHNNLDKQAAGLLAKILARHRERRDTQVWTCTLRGGPLRLPEGLLELLVSFNQLQNEGWKQIIHTLWEDNWIKYIDVRNNQLTKSSLKLTAQLADQNTSLLVLDTRDNSHSNLYLESIVSSLECNFSYLKERVFRTNYAQVSLNVLSKNPPTPSYHIRAFEDKRKSFSVIRKSSSARPAKIKQTNVSIPSAKTEDNHNCTCCVHCKSTIQQLSKDLKDLESQNFKLRGKLQKPRLVKHINENSALTKAQNMLSEVGHIITELENK